MTGKRMMIRLQAIVVIALLASLAAIACGNAAVIARTGDTVKVDYTGTYDNGSAFDSSINESFGHVEPLEFTIGAGQVIPGFEQAVIGLAVNQSTTFTIPPEEAYGEKYFEVDLSELPSDLDVGETLYDESGRSFVVTNISETTATLENTHPLAGENLTFDVTLVEVVK